MTHQIDRRNCSPGISDLLTEPLESNVAEIFRAVHARSIFLIDSLNARATGLPEGTLM